MQSEQIHRTLCKPTHSHQGIVFSRYKAYDPPFLLPTKLDDNTIIIPLYYHNNTINYGILMVS